MEDCFTLVNLSSVSKAISLAALPFFLYNGIVFLVSRWKEQNPLRLCLVRCVTTFHLNHLWSDQVWWKLKTKSWVLLFFYYLNT